MIGITATELPGSQPQGSSKLAALFTGWAETVASVIKEGQSAGETSTALDAKTLAGFLLSAWEGTLIRVRATRDPALLKQFQRAAFDSLLK
jgi:TetR/AcrR family transcriptional repressor of nem operon